MPLNSLEQQALDRMGRMYASFDNRPNRPPHGEHPAPPPREHHEQPQPPRPEPPHPEPRPEPPAPPAHPEKPPGFLDMLLEDKEQSLLMLLLVILLKDGADLNTILALLYILM